MRIGPLEDIAIGVKDEPFRTTILPELKAFQQEGLIRVVDLLCVTKAAGGQVALREVTRSAKRSRASFWDDRGGADPLSGQIDVAYSASKRAGHPLRYQERQGAERGTVGVGPASEENDHQEHPWQQSPLTGEAVGHLITQQGRPKLPVEVKIRAKPGGVGTVAPPVTRGDKRIDRNQGV
jgi:hypothetical protein